MPVSTWSWSRPTAAAIAQRGLHYELLRIETHYQFYKRDGSWNYEPVKTTKRVADGTIDTTPDKPARISLPVNFGRYRLEVSTTDPNGPLTSVAFDAGFYVEANADTPDMLEIALDKGEYRARRHHDGGGHRAQRRPADAQCGRRPAAGDADDRRARKASSQVKLPVGSDWGTGAYLVATLAPAARCAGAAHAGPRHRRAMVLGRSRRQDAHASS